jgi:hypothetical protein
MLVGMAVSAAVMYDDVSYDGAIEEMTAGFDLEFHALLKAHHDAVAEWLGGNRLDAAWASVEIGSHLLRHALCGERRRPGAPPAGAQSDA